MRTKAGSLSKYVLSRKWKKSKIYANQLFAIQSSQLIKSCMEAGWARLHWWYIELRFEHTKERQKIVQWHLAWEKWQTENKSEKHSKKRFVITHTRNNGKHNICFWKKTKKGCLPRPHHDENQANHVTLNRINYKTHSVFHQMHLHS